MKKVVFGLASGIGNAVFCLPVIRMLKERGSHVVLYVEGDYDMLLLWQRCVWADRVVDARVAPPPSANEYLSGHWCPLKLKRIESLKWARWVHEPGYDQPEWALALSLLGPPRRVDVTGWCRGFTWEPRYDFGIIPGCKPGEVWGRKRYPYMDDVAEELVKLGFRVATIGLPDDVDDLNENYYLGQTPLHLLPDQLGLCRAIIGTDSGPAHLASSLGLPVTMIFTGTDTMKGDPVGPVAWKLFRNDLDCRPCQSTARWGQCGQWRCQEIPPHEVVETALSMLQ